jgi:VCBS repeat-containing protein
MTEDMFPLALNMETFDRTLSPDATKNTIPVTAGPSIIESRNNELSYYYTWTIPTLDAYKALPNDGNMKVVTTHWLTNMAANASTFYVANKYFNQASDSWGNYKYEFSNATCSSSAVGVGEDVTISFSMADGAINKPVTISLEGMTYNGATEVTYTTSQKNVNLTCKTTTETDSVSFTLDADDYNIASAEGSRQTYTFN